MTDDIQVVGRVGVTRLHLIGGPLDGVVKWGVIGSAVVVRLKKPKQTKQASSSYGSWMFYLSVGRPIEGGDWKETDAAGMTRHYQHHAVYVPVLRGGKATDRVMFEGIFAVDVPVPKQLEPMPQPEYEAEEDEDGDDD